MWKIVTMCFTKPLEGIRYPPLSFSPYVLEEVCPSVHGEQHFLARLAGQQNKPQQSSCLHLSSCPPGLRCQVISHVHLLCGYQESKVKSSRMCSKLSFPTAISHFLSHLYFLNSLSDVTDANGEF